MNRSQAIVAAADKGTCGDLTRVDVLFGHVDMAPLGHPQTIRVEARHYAQMSGDRNIVVRPRPPEVLYLVGMATYAADRLMAGRLEGLGFLVTTRREATSADDLQDKALVFISASVDSPFVPGILRESRIPIVVCDPWVIDDLGMTAAGDAQNTFRPGQRTLTVNGKAQTLAAGLAGDVVLTTLPAPLGLGAPGPHATVAATLADRPEAQGTIFSYDEGVDMLGLKAPARRLAFLVSEQAVETFTQAGWSLFDAAIKWSIGGVVQP